MTVPDTIKPEDGDPPTYTCTFGIYNQTSPWTDVRPLAWSELAALLTQHEIGPKEGSCLVPAIFSGTKRAKADAVRIDVAFLDSDAGSTMQEISSALSAKGWQAVISSSHSHMTTTTKVKRGNWDKYRAAAGAADDMPTRYLVETKGYLPGIAAGATVASQTDEFTFFEHQACPKFRIALPLHRSWLAASYDNQREANATWKERIEALAGALGLSHDQACTDTSRLFYLPRRPADGPEPETAVLEGELCDIFALPKAEPAAKKRPSRNSKSDGRKVAPRDDGIEYSDPSTGETSDLRKWVRQRGRVFQLASALKARRPDLFVPRSGEGCKHHIRCVNEEAHTQAGADAATFVIDASESTSKHGFIYHCRHAHCDGGDRLLFIKQMLEQDWLHVVDLTDPKFLADPSQVRSVIRFVGGEIANVVDQAEAALIAAHLRIYQRGNFVVRPGRVAISISKEQEISAQSPFRIGSSTSQSS